MSQTKHGGTNTGKASKCNKASLEQCTKWKNNTGQKVRGMIRGK